MAHVCPWWLGYLLINPLRKLVEDPEKMLGPHIRPGLTILDVGCGMGYFSLPAARLTGADGRVIGVDLQPKMLDGLRRRALKAGLAERIEARSSAAPPLGVGDLAGKIDLVLTIHMVHEVPDKKDLFVRIVEVLRPGGRLLFIEPPRHVTPAAFEESLAVAREAGLRVVERPKPLAAVLEKAPAAA